jgi:excisionase family DNA binding protein
MERAVMTASPQISPRLLALPEVGVYLSRTLRGVQGLVLKKAFPVVRAGRTVRVDRKDLDNWIEENKE